MSASAEPKKEDKKDVKDTKAPAETETSVQLDESTSEVEFKAVGYPTFLKVDGKGSQLKGKFTVTGRQVTGEARFPLSTLSTGIGLRDSHMKEKYLQVKKHPDAVFTLTQLELTGDFTKKNVSFDQIPFTGWLTLRGNKHPVKGTVDVLKNGREVTIYAKFATKISYYNIPQPGYMGITVADDVDVFIKATGTASSTR